MRDFLISQKSLGLNLPNFSSFVVLIFVVVLCCSWRAASNSHNDFLECLFLHSKNKTTLKSPPTQPNTTIDTTTRFLHFQQRRRLYTAALANQIKSEENEIAKIPQTLPSPNLFSVGDQNAPNPSPYFSATVAGAPPNGKIKREAEKREIYSSTSRVLERGWGRERENKGK